MKNLVYEQIQARKLRRWDAEYNEDRPHLALKGKTLAERVRELVQPSKFVRDVS
jgi:hypothetical protein